MQIGFRAFQQVTCTAYPQRKDEEEQEERERRDFEQRRERAREKRRRRSEFTRAQRKLRRVLNCVGPDPPPRGGVKAALAFVSMRFFLLLAQSESSVYAYASAIRGHNECCSYGRV